MAALQYPLDARNEKVFRRVLAAVGEPWKGSKRGRRPKRTPLEYALALFSKAFHGFSYRTAALVLRVPRSCLHWAFKRLSAAWVRSLVERTAKRLRSMFAVKCAILNSTGVSLRGTGFKRRYERRPYMKLHGFVEYAPWAHRVWFARARATSSRVHDVLEGRRMLGDAPPSELYADKAYDAKSLYSRAYELGWEINMQQRKNAASRRGTRGKVWRSYDDRKRKKYRGRVEAPFGGFASRYGSRVSEKLTSTRRRACELWAAAHNIRTLAKSALDYLWDSLAEQLPR